MEGRPEGETGGDSPGGSVDEKCNYIYLEAR